MNKEELHLKFLEVLELITDKGDPIDVIVQMNRYVSIGISLLGVALKGVGDLCGEDEKNKLIKTLIEELHKPRFSPINLKDICVKKKERDHE